MAKPSQIRLCQCLLVMGLLAYASFADARTLQVPVRFGDELIRQYLIEEAYTDADTTAQAWDDGYGCNYLTLSDPKVAIESGTVRVTSAAHGQVGTALGDQCLVLPDWSGVIEVYEQPALSAQPGVVEFQVVNSKIYREDGKSGGIIDTLWDWVKQYAHPPLERLKLDLNPALSEVRAMLPMVFPDDQAPAQKMLDSVALSDVQADDGYLVLTMQFDVPERLIAPPATNAEPVLTAEELQRWAQATRDVDVFLTQVIKRMGADTALAAHRAKLLDVLVDMRAKLLSILASPPTDGADPMRKLFLKTWSRLAPILRAESSQLPPESALRWLSFMAAADVLQTIDELAPDLEFTLSAGGLRHLARIAAPEESTDALEYDFQVDPELRRSLGFGKPLAPPRVTPPQQTAGSDLSHFFFIKSAYAADNPYDALVDRLTGWLPTSGELHDYLSMVRELLSEVAQSTAAEGGMTSDYQQIFHSLVLATAWQESCWRQFVESNGKYVPISSGTGSTGIMQVNEQVWRGFYDVDGLNWDIGYNARAGADILRHYLVDYAIAKDEQIASGDVQNLARATYAMYNGGPGAMTRYRDGGVSESLRAIDETFWEKYQTIQKGDPLAVAECYSYL
jgi:hypothetical protein